MIPRRAIVINQWSAACCHPQCAYGPSQPGSPEGILYVGGQTAMLVCVVSSFAGFFTVAYVATAPAACATVPCILYSMGSARILSRGVCSAALGAALLCKTPETRSWWFRGFLLW